MAPARTLAKRIPLAVSCAPMLDLSGKTFGKLTVVGRSDIPCKWGVTWNCRCECGNTRSVLANLLNSGQVKSCVPCSTTAKDITGQRFGRWTVISRGESKRYKNGTSIYWNVVCDCGTKRAVDGRGLRSGGSKSCGCLDLELKKQRISERQVDLTGTSEAFLTYIGEADSEKSIRRIRCRCVCGNEVIVPAQYYMDGQSKSCGCWNKRILRGRALDLTGHTYNRWTVLKRDEERTGTYWICRCECGTEGSVSTSNLRGGQSKSCGCLNLERTLESNKKRLESGGYQKEKHGSRS